MESGLIPGTDQIVSVNGMAVASSRDVVRGSHRTELRRLPRSGPTGRDRTVTVDVMPAFLPTRVEWIFTLIFCLALSTTAFALSWKLPHVTWSVPLVLSALFSLLFTCLKPVAYANVVSNALFNLGNIGSWLLVIFALLFPWERGAKTVRIVSIISILVLFALFCFLRVSLSTRWLSTGEESVLDAYRTVGQIGNAGDGVAYLVIGCLLGSASARTSHPRDRAILQWLLAGMLIALPPYFFFDQLPLVLGGDAARIGLGALAQLFLSVLPLSLLAGLMAQRAFSFRAFVARYVVYGILFILLVALFAIVYLPLRGAIQAGYSMGSPLPELLSVSLIFFLLVIIRFPLERISVGFLARLTDTRHEIDSPAADGPRPQPDMESPAEQRLNELRTMLKGIAKTLKDPVHRLAELAAVSPALPQQAAGMRLVELTRSLDRLSSAGPFIRTTTTPQAIARAAAASTPVAPGIRIEAGDEGGSRVSCCFAEVACALSCALQNAAESQSEAGVPILVRISRNEQDAVIEVIDHGCGVEAFVRKRLFSPFVSTKPGHAGLGLCVSRAIMERDDGALELVSGEEGGTVARFTLPRIRKSPGTSKESL